MALTASIILLFVFLVGLSVGVGITALVMSARRTTIVEVSNEPPTLRDPSNPYEPSNIIGRAKRSPSGCTVAVAVFLIVDISLLAFAATYFLASTTTVKTAPLPPPPVPPPVVQPQSSAPPPQ